MRLGKREGLTVGDRVGRELVGDVEGSCDGARELEGLHVGCAEGGVLIIGLLLLLRAKANKPNVLVVPASRYNPPDTNSSVPHYELHHRGHNV